MKTMTTIYVDDDPPAFNLLWFFMFKREIAHDSLSRTYWSSVWIDHRTLPMVLVWSKRVGFVCYAPYVPVLCELRLLPGIRWHFRAARCCCNRCSCLRRLQSRGSEWCLQTKYFCVWGCISTPLFWRVDKSYLPFLISDSVINDTIMPP
jgi:hypothetical protein